MMKAMDTLLIVVAVIFGVAVGSILAFTAYHVMYPEKGHWAAKGAVILFMGVVFLGSVLFVSAPAFG